ELILPRQLFVEVVAVRNVQPPPARAGRAGAAPGEIVAPGVKATAAELARHPGFPGKKDGFWTEKCSLALNMTSRQRPAGSPGEHVLEAYLMGLAGAKEFVADGRPAVELRKDFDPDVRQKRQFDQLCAFTQQVMRDSEAHRAETF